MFVRYTFETTATRFRFYVPEVVNKNAISIVRIGSIAAVMLGERFVYLRIRDIYIYIGPGNMFSIERGRNVRRRRNWQSFFPSSSPIPRFIPPSSSPEHRQNRGTFRNPASSSSRAIAPFISFISELPFDHNLLLFSSPWQSAVEVFCNPRKWCIPKGNRFHPWTRPLCTSEPDILVSASSEICRNFNVSKVIFPFLRPESHVVDNFIFIFFRENRRIEN